MIRTLVFFGLVINVTQAHAQTVPPCCAPAPPPPCCNYPTTQIVPAPPPVYANFPSPADDLERRGRSKKIAGGLMIGLGAAALVGGSIALGFVHDASFLLTDSQQTNLLVGGSIAALAGGLTLLAGIPVAIIGAHQVNKARR